MKGFAATPVVFIAVFLIVAMLFLHFMDMDKRIAESIGKEARLRKLQANSMKGEMSSESAVFFSSLFFAQFSSGKGELENYLSNMTNTTVTASRKPNAMVVSFNEWHNISLDDAKMNRSVNASANVPYPFFELTDAASTFDLSRINNKDCNDAGDIISDYLGSFAPVVWYPNMTWMSCYSGSGNWRCPFNLTLLYNWVDKDYFSERYPHYVGKSYAGECYYP